MPYRKVSESEWQLMVRTTNELKKQIAQLRADQRTKVPIYDYNGLPPDAVEGQVAILRNAPALVAGGGTLPADLPWAYVRRSNISLVSATTNTTVDFDTTNGNVAGGTDGSGAFDVNILSGGNHGIRINQNGTFLWVCNVQMQRNTAPSANSVAGVLSNLDSGSIFAGDYYNPFYTPNGSVWNGDCTLVGWFNADPNNTTIPTTGLMSINQNSGATITGVRAQFAIVMISQITSPNFF